MLFNHETHFLTFSTKREKHISADLEELPTKIRRSMTFVPVESMDEVLATALVAKSKGAGEKGEGTAATPEPAYAPETCPSLPFQPFHGVWRRIHTRPVSFVGSNLSNPPQGRL
jgi:hypothetical protein